MNWAMLSGARRRVLTAVAIGGLVAIPVLTVPAPAFALPTPPDDPADCAIDPTSFSCEITGNNENNENDVPTGPDDPRCVQMPLSPGCQGGPYDEDDDD
jgi:hypothetical protein